VNCNIGFKVSINSGAALILFVINFHLLIIEAALWPAIERIYPVAVGALTGAVAGFLVKRANNNKLYNSAELEKIKSGRDTTQEGV